MFAFQKVSRGPTTWCLGNHKVMWAVGVIELTHGLITESCLHEFGMVGASQYCGQVVQQARHGAWMSILGFDSPELRMLMAGNQFTIRA